jgi:NitT/TauT family transport system substrate-binding protein
VSAAGTAAATATTGPLRKVRIAVTGQGVAYLPHQIALVQGFDREAGFDAEIQTLAGNAMFAAVVAGEVDFADSGGSGIRAAAAGLPVRLATCHGVRFLNWMLLAPGVGSVRDLEDKAVAVASVGGDNELIARDLIRKQGGDPSKVQYVGLGASDVRYSALLSGRVGGAIVSSTEAIQARKANLTVAGTPSDLPLACNESVVVAQPAISERPEVIRNYVRAVQRAVQFMQAEREASARILAEWQQLDIDDTLAAYDESQVKVTFSTDKATGEQAIKNSIEMARSSGDITTDVQVSDVADLSLSP